MDPILDVKSELVARSRTESLDDLRNRGRKEVKVIRAEHIAEMVSEAVQRVVRDSGMIPRDEVDQLVERGQAEFKNVIREREHQLQMANAAARELEEVKADRVRLQASLQEVMAERNQLREDLEAARAGQSAPGAAGDAGAALAAMFASLGGGQGGEAGAGSAAGGAEIMMRLMNEFASMKGGGASGGAGGGGTDVTAAIDKLAGSLNARLEQFGRKIGISSAVEAADVKFDGLFDREASASVESNMDSVTVKTKKEGSINANLERLKKLKGGG